MSQSSFISAVNRALYEILSTRDDTILLGEDVGSIGGRMGVTQGLLQKVGHQKVRDVPVSEEIMVGIALGAANGGLKPIIEILNSDFLPLAFDDMWRVGLWGELYQGHATSDVLIRTSFGGYTKMGPEFSSSAVGYLTSIPNVKIFAPAFPEDAYNILISLIEEPGLKIYLEHKALYKKSYFKKKPQDPFMLYSSNILSREKNTPDLILITYSYMTTLGIEAAEVLEEKQGIIVQIIDLKCIWPLDFRTIIPLTHKANNVLIVEECAKNSGISVWIENNIRIARPNIRLATVHAKQEIIPFGRQELLVLPSISDIVNESLRLVQKG